MSTRRRARGNTLVLAIACIGFIALLVAFFALNYAGLFGAHKEAQTAIDAAALAAAKAMADPQNSAINHPRIGQIGLVDAPVDIKAVPTAGSGVTRTLPITGINTALAIARLDLLIARNLSPTNATMASLAQRDLTSLRNAMELIAAQLEANKPKVQNAAYQAYISNNRRMTNASGNPPISDVTVQFGRLNGEVATNVPVPEPVDSEAAANNVNMFYKAYHVYQDQIVFSACADEPKLVDQRDFVGDLNMGGGLTVPPTVVRVTVKQPVQSTAATDSAGTRAVDAVVVAACAETGGTRATNNSGIFCFSFRAGFPPNQGVDMSNVASAMNGGGYQNPGGTRTWFQGAPDTGSPPNIPVPANFNDTASNNSSAGRISDQANIALSVGIYNWLRQMGLRPNWSSVLAALKHDLRSLVPNGGGTTVTAWNTADPFIPPAYAATNGGTMPTTTVWTSVPQGMAADPRSMQNILQSGQPGDSTVQMANVFGYVPAGVPAPPTAAAVFIDSNGNPTSTSGKPLDEIVWVQDSITTTNAAGKIATTAGERVYNEMAAEEQRLTSEITALQADMSSKQAQQQQYRGQANALRSQAGGTPPPSNADSLRSQADSLDRQASALDGPIADDQSKINAKQNDLTNRVRPTKARGDRCNQRGAQAMDVTTKMLQNFQALTAIGCSGQVPQFSLGGSTFWAHNFVANQLAPKDPAQVTEAQISAMVAMIKDKNSQLDCKSAPGEVWDKTAALTIYQRTASASPPIPAIGNRFGMFSPAYARNASPMPPNSFVGFQQPNLNLMFLYSVRGDASKDRGQGQMYITALPTSPFIRQNTEAGQVFYSNIQALQTAGPTVAGRGPLTLTWAMFMRDNVANPHAPPTYLQGLRDIRNATDSNRNNLNWCQDGAKDLNGNSYNVNLPDAGDASFVCPTLDGEFVISCPMVSGCSEGMSINNKTGTAEVKPCPPPDPPMG